MLNWRIVVVGLSTNINVTARLALYDGAMVLSLVTTKSVRKLWRGPEKVGLLYLNVELEGNAKKCVGPFHLVPPG